MDVTQGFFEVFDLPASFQLDIKALDDRYHDLQKIVHPDSHAGGPASELRRAVQLAAHVNTAYETLRKPLPRALYLLESAGIEIEANPQLDPMFLMEQIELRETLEELGEQDEPLAALDDFKGDVTEREQVLFAAFDHEYDAGDLDAATATVYKIQFLHKLAVAANQLEEKLLDY